MMQPFDKGLEVTMETYWTSFAKTGAPAPKEGDPEWLNFGASHTDFVLISPSSEARKAPVEFERCKFWEGLSEEVKLEACLMAAATRF